MNVLLLANTSSSFHPAMNKRQFLSGLFTTHLPEIIRCQIWAEETEVQQNLWKLAAVLGKTADFILSTRLTNCAQFQNAGKEEEWLTLFWVRHKLPEVLHQVSRPVRYPTRAEHQHSLLVFPLALWLWKQNKDTVCLNFCPSSHEIFNHSNILH